MIKYYINYNEKTQEKQGFYNTDIWDIENIPKPYAEISQESWLKELGENHSHFDPETGEFYNGIVEPKEEDKGEVLNELKEKFMMDKNSLLNEYNNNKALAELKNDAELLEDLKEDYAEDLEDLEEKYYKDLEDVKNGN